MQTSILGRTRLAVSRLSLGGLFVSSVGADYDAARGAVKRAFDLGVNYIDTAPGYANSEEVLGKVFADLGQQPAILSTKLGGRPQPFLPQDRDCLMTSLEQSLKLLNRDCIDILMIHEPDRPGQYDWWTDMQAVDGPVLTLLDDLKRQGIIKHTGLGGTTVYEMAHLIRSGKFDVVLTAFNYSLLYREAEVAVLPAAAEHNVGVVIGSPLQQGAFAHKFEAIEDDSVYWLSPARRTQFKELYALVDELGMPIAELALRWVFSNPQVDTVLMGARSEREVELNAEAVAAGPLSEDILDRLDTIAAQVPFRPWCEPFGMGWKLGYPAGHKGPASA